LFDRQDTNLFDRESTNHTRSVMEFWSVIKQGLIKIAGNLSFSQDNKYPVAPAITLNRFTTQ